MLLAMFFEKLTVMLKSSRPGLDGFLMARAMSKSTGCSVFSSDIALRWFRTLRRNDHQAHFWLKA